MGIIGIDGRRYPLPSVEDIAAEIRERKEWFAEKIPQGFTDLQIVPFALPLKRLINTLKKQLVKHHEEGKLYRTKKNLADPNEPLKVAGLDVNEPVLVWE